MRPKTCGQAFVTAFAIATVLVAPCAANLVVAGGVARYARGVPTARAADHGSFANYNQVHGYYTHHGQYVPGAGDRLIYGPGYVFVPGRGFSARIATCRQVPVRTSTAISNRRCTSDESGQLV